MTVEEKHTLSEEVEFAEWIDYTNFWITLGNGTALPPIPPIITSTDAYTSGYGYALEARAMIAKSLILVFKRTINPPICMAKGLFDGIIQGLKDDITCCVQFPTFFFGFGNGVYDIASGDYRRASEFFHGVKYIASHPGDILTMFMNSVDGLVDQADAAIPWRLDSSLDNYPAVSRYLGAYFFGYAVEQIAVFTAGAGVVVKAGQGVKCLMELSRIGRLTLSGYSASKQFSCSFLRSASMTVTSAAEALKLTDMLTYLKKTLFQGEKIADILNKYNNWYSKVAILRAEVNLAWDTAWGTVGRRTMERLAELTQKMYMEMPWLESLTSDACEGFLKAYPKRLYVSETEDRLDDLLKLYKKGDGSTDFPAINDSLQEFKNAMGDKPLLKIENAGANHEYSGDMRIRKGS